MSRYHTQPVERLHDGEEWRMNAKDRKILRKLMSGRVPNTARILDVGCGLGQGMRFLHALGYRHVVGVDISPDMVEKARASGLEAYGIGDVAGKDLKFDLVVFSHVLEHVEHGDLQALLERYFAMLDRGNGSMIVLSPVLYHGFFDDIDHVAPCYPLALLKLFSGAAMSRQYASPYRIALTNVYFRREPLVPFFMRSRYFEDMPSRVFYKTARALCAFLNVVSLGALSRVTGYGALFTVRALADKPSETR